uniref:KH and NYN domain containing n=1 Tax=Cynoglossus semilaevis TaxID=244447 RepID=A0A3P8WQL3_CYNSE
MDNQRRNGEAEVEDEFACAGMLRGSLTSLHDAVERIFQVTFGIGADDLPQGNNGQIWLKLCGTSKNVEAAKLFVKGIVNQEAQQQVSYPKVLHCIFCGAKGLFMDCLIKTTSAHVMVASPGNLLISGLAEPVVQAYSLITELVERYEGTRHSETGDRVPSESIESRRAFKTLVEKREDRHILDLLVLPGWVKEILLDFVKESGLDSISDLEVREGNAGSHDQTSAMNTNFRPFITADWEEEGTAAVSRNKSSSKTSSSSTIKKQKHSPAQRHTVRTEMREFFTAMGYTESVVNRVLARTGPKEASQILDLVQQEQDRSDQEQVLHGFSDMRVLFPRMTTPQQLPVSQFVSQPKQHQLSESRTPHRNIHSDIKGPPMTLYPSLSDAPPAPNIPTKAHFEHTIHVPNLTMLKQKHYSQDNVGNHLPSNSQKKVLPNPDMIRNNLSPTRMTHQHGSTPASTVVVTGEQRFLEGLQTPFDLELTDKPGVQKLRAIIIDGSNVAMSHGLGHFFSCRGIALAVQHFWDRGHREIQVLVPQWRQKSDPRIKEKHFMSKLYDLGLLSYTPSREVQGRRISCYDDRFMLQHAEKTNGVIVTNDNLRDLIDESEKWTDIIKKSLLQYTFVGDHFMVPDDPLGRGGPHLEDFLRSEPRNTLTGVATTSSSSKPLHSQAEVPNHWTRFGTQSGNRQLHKAGPQRNPEQTSRLREQLCQIFPGQDNEVALVLQCHPTETDICMLTDEILELQKN